MAGGAVSQPEKSTESLTESPEPGPAPLGPLKWPHQLPVNFWEAESSLKTAVLPLPAIQLFVTVMALTVSVTL